MFNKLVKKKAAFKIASASNYSKRGRRHISFFYKILFSFSLNDNRIQILQEYSKTLGMSYLYSIYDILLKYFLRLVFITICFQTESTQNAATVIYTNVCAF